MTALFRFIAIATVLALFFAGCRQSQPADTHADENDIHAEDTNAQPEADDHDDENIVVVLTPAELDEFDIEVATAGGHRIAITTDLPGEVVMNPDTVAHVVGRASGIVREVLVTIGDTVSAGDSLAVLESPPLAEAKAEYLSRARELELSKTDLTRAETVYENTRKLLDVLGETPALDALREFSDLDLGENRNMLVSAYAKFVATQATYNREKSLFEKKIGSEAEYLDAESTFKQAQAAFLSVRDDIRFSNSRTLDQRRREAKVAEVALLAAKRRLHALGLSGEDLASIPQQIDMELSRYVIEAPLDGVITERHIVRGEQIEQADDIFMVADLSTVWVYLTVYQKDLAFVKPGQPVEIVASHGIGQVQGTVQYVSSVISESTRTATARVVLLNPDGLWRPGLFVSGRVQTGAFEATVAVPKTAVQSIGDEQVIFVLTEHGFEPKNVVLGRANGTYVEIVEGIEPGEAYVAVGGFALKAELNKAGFEGDGHGH